jgi:hypothetical protein
LKKDAKIEEDDPDKVRKQFKIKIEKLKYSKIVLY